MFLDEAVITVQGGDGGRGCVSWRREKFEPMGGPDGGDGGRGGDVFVLADANTDTLSDFASRKKFAAEKGRFGSGKNKHGKDGTDIVLKVPPGTVVREVGDDGETGETVADLTRHGDRVLVASGGRGGYGNAHFKSSTRQAPDFAELGEPGVVRRLKLELKLVADVGIIGYPSVGKSTLISVISAARPKIADYPFTTLIPNLGVVTVDDRSYVVSDLPGLIEGASEGKGLGDRFLRHIERSRILLHVLDVSRSLEAGEPDARKLRADYDAIRKELTAYSPSLARKKELIVLNKVDLLPDPAPLLRELKDAGLAVYAGISAATRQGTEELRKTLLPLVLAERRENEAAEEREQQEAALPVLRPHLTSIRMGAYRVETRPDGTVEVFGKRLEQFTKMTDFASRGAVERFRDVTDRIGLKKAVRAQMRDDDTPVLIAGIRVEEYL